MEKTTIALGALLVGVAGTASIWMLPRHPEPPNKAKERSSIDEGAWRSDGAFCSTHMPTACVFPNGEVYIPRGDAMDTLWAYRALSPAMQGAKATDFVGVRTGVETQAVHGRYDTRETIERMLVGTGLKAYVYPDPDDDGNSVTFAKPLPPDAWRKPERPPP